MIRRAAALIVSGLILQLNLLGIERACGPRHETARASAEHAHHSSQPPTPAPVQPPAKCCDALSACAMSFVLGADRAVSVAASPGTIVAAPGKFYHPVPRRAPDPPPPRA